MHFQSQSSWLIDGNHLSFPVNIYLKGKESPSVGHDLIQKPTIESSHVCRDKKQRVCGKNDHKKCQQHILYLKAATSQTFCNILPFQTLRNSSGWNKGLDDTRTVNFERYWFLILRWRGSPEQWCRASSCRENPERNRRCRGWRRWSSWSFETDCRPRWLRPAPPYDNPSRKSGASQGPPSPTTTSCSFSPLDRGMPRKFTACMRILARCRRTSWAVSGLSCSSCGNSNSSNSSSSSGGSGGGNSGSGGGGSSGGGNNNSSSSDSPLPRDPTRDEAFSFSVKSRFVVIDEPTGGMQRNVICVKWLISFSFMTRIKVTPAFLPFPRRLLRLNV